MNEEEARRFLEDRDFCMTHFVRMERAKGKKLACPTCEAEKLEEEEAQIERAVKILRHEPLPPMNIQNWMPCEPGKFPKDGERVYFLCVGFVERAGRAGGHEHFITGKPTHWRRK